MLKLGNIDIKRWPIWLIATLWVSWGIRFATILLNHTGLGWADLRGLASDAVISVFVSVLVSLIVDAKLKRSWVKLGLAGLVLALWVVIGLGNFEHVLANDANLDPENLKYLSNPEFLKGSGLRFSHPIVGVSIIAGLIAIFVAAIRWPMPSIITPRLKFGLVGVVAVMLWPISNDALLWRQENPVFGLTRLLNGQPLPANTGVQLSSDAPKEWTADLSGKPRFAFSESKRPPNVMIVMLEGISGAFVQSMAKEHRVNLDVKMPKLSALSQKNFAAASFIAHQRQTDRGEYAILCGDLPKLARVTPRMTDIARSGAQRTCLPEFLADKGYQTIYLQPAPMTFMLKDQFVAKTGFTESFGAEFFSSGYKKGGWGIDDRAFFEQSLKLLKDRDKKGPWMAAMMTVGTHHPMIVPRSFKRLKDEDSFAWAARYTDQAIDEMITAMRKDGLLDHTIVLITSDESRGLHEQYGGVTRSISQNWSLLTAVLPGGQSSMVTEPYAQSDVALSVVDYLGLYDRSAPFVGRSLFREYRKPRAMVFSNIFKRRAHLLDETGRLTLCSEDFLSCTDYTRKNKRFFGPGWDSEGTSPRSTVNRLRQWVAHSSKDVGEAQSQDRVSLVSPDIGVIEVTREGGWGSFLFGGQFLYAPPERRVVVDVDLEVAGKGAAVELSAKLEVEYKDRYKVPSIRPLVDGDRLRLRYSYTQDGPLKRVDAVMFAKKLSPNRAELIVRKAEVRFVDLGKDEDENAGGKVEVLDISYRDLEERWQSYASIPRTKKHYSVFSEEGYRRSDCVTLSDRGELVGRRCGRGRPIAGPYKPVAARSQVQAKFLIRSLKGSASVSAEVVSNWGKVSHAWSNKALVNENEEVEIMAAFETQEAIALLETHLVIVPSHRDFDFEIIEGTLDVTPLPEPPGND